MFRKNAIGKGHCPKVHVLGHLQRRAASGHLRNVRCPTIVRGPEPIPLPLARPAIRTALQGVMNMNPGRLATVPEFALLSHRQDPRPFGASFILQISLLLFIAVLPRKSSCRQSPANVFPATLRERPTRSIPRRALYGPKLTFRIATASSIQVPMHRCISV